jgi:hypothetical protein
MTLKPLFKHPIGASADCSAHSNGNSKQMESLITCQLCGTKDLKGEDESENPAYYFHFLGYKGVLQCCGRVIDILYQQWGLQFFQKTLTAFQKEPLSCDNYVIRMLLKDAVFFVS